MAKIIIPTPLRKFTGQNRIFETDKETLSGALNHLVTTYPDLKQNLMDDEGNVRSFIKIYVGDDEVQPGSYGVQKLDRDTQVSIVPAIAGGSDGNSVSEQKSVNERNSENDRHSRNGGPEEDQSFRNVELSSQELQHYSRHITIPEFGMEGQKKLKGARVLSVGSGGLGAPMLQYLAAAGVGTIGIVDYDTVDASNLHRQVLFGASDVGRPKVEVAKERLQQINPHIEIRIHETRLTSDNALDILRDYDIVADGTDNFPTRYLINDATVMLDKPNVHGSIFQFEGQVSVFNYVDEEGRRGPNYRDLFPEPPPPGMVPDCAEAGVLGVLPGIIGSMQANEVIKLITGLGEPLSGKLFLFDALSFTTRTMKVGKDKANPLTGDHPTITELIDYEMFCGVSGNGEEEESVDEVPEVTVREFKEWLDSGEKIQVIDVREPHEYDIAEIGGELIPLKTVTDNADKIARDRKVVVHCRSGKRSADAIRELRQKFGYDNLYNLKGGILAWSEEIDPEVPRY